MGELFQSKKPINITNNKKNIIYYNILNDQNYKSNSSLLIPIFSDNN